MDDIEELAAERPNRCPSHPGKILRDGVLPALRLTAHMAVRLGGNGPRLWLRMRQAHDLWLAEKALEEALKHIPSHADQAA